jgi:hypothetical protein
MPTYKDYNYLRRQLKNPEDLQVQFTPLFDFTSGFLAGCAPSWAVVPTAPPLPPAPPPLRYKNTRRTRKILRALGVSNLQLFGRAQLAREVEL